MSIIQGSTKTHTTVNGTPGSDIFLVPAAFTTINGGGGSDNVFAQSGYAVFNQGAPYDGLTSNIDNLTLAGQQNTVSGGDANFTITDVTGGQNAITLGDGDDTIVLAGSYNNITLGTGESNITFLNGGNNNITYNSSEVGNGSTANIALSGTHNTIAKYYFGSPGHSGISNAFSSAVITGGDGYNSIGLTASSATVVLGGFYNTVNIGQGTGDITPGSGHDTVVLMGFPEESDFGSRFVGDYTVHLQGVGNTVSGDVGSLTVDGGDGSNHFIFEVPNDNYDNYRPFTPPLVYTVTTGGLNNVFALRDLDINTIVTGSGNASVTILTINVGPPNPFDTTAPAPVYPGSTITFAGLNNVLDDLGQAGNTITGGTGRGTFVLGSGNSTLTTGGSGNKVTAGAGKDTISPGSDHAIVTLNGTNAHLLLQGDGNAVFLNSGASGVIDGASPNLHINVAAGIGAEVLNGLAGDPHTVIALTGGAGGYSSTAQIVAALQSDGHGGTMLAIASGSLDFAGVAPSGIAASMFVIKA